MTVINTTELRKKSIDELKVLLFSSLEQRFKLRMQSSSSEQEVKPHLIKEIRRNVARIKTVVNEKKLSEK
jgi:large subunit ribosomal protein L29